MIEQASLAWWGEAPEQPNRTQQGVARVRGYKLQRPLTAEPLGGTAGIFSGGILPNGLKSYIRKLGALWTNGSARVLASIQSIVPRLPRASGMCLGRSGASPHHANR
jgi:hypothetical protein